MQHGRTSTNRPRPRLTRVDWQVINEALALYEASLGDMVDDGLVPRSRVGAVKRVRDKVWDRLG